MRLLFLSLLFANLALFAWTRWLAPGSAATAASPALEVPRILLVGESSAGGAGTAPAAAPPAADAEAATAGADAVGAAAADSTRCVSVGPLTNLDAAARVNGVLVELGYQPRQRPADGQIPDGWLVLVSGQADATEQANVERRLKRGGLDDAARLPEADGAFAVSAGLFSELRRAERRAEVVRRIGLVPSIEPRLKAGTVYWIDIDLRNAADAGSLESMQLGDAGLRLEACAATTPPVDTAVEPAAAAPPPAAAPISGPNPADRG
jgi:hypothetical protein